jgi:hypothetical protein
VSIKKNLYAIIDTASGVYDGPFKGVSDGQMIRMFNDLCVDAEHPIGKHPEDFSLIKVGTWNEGTGELEDLQNTTMITGLEAVAESRKVRNVDMDEVVSFGGTN